MWVPDDHRIILIFTEESYEFVVSSGALFIIVR